MFQTPKICVYASLFLTLSGCSSLSGSWPNLAEPYPDASERVRVIERANPVEPTIAQDESPLTRSTAFKHLESTRARLEKAQEDYLAVKAKIKSASGEDKSDLWNEAQLLLTRLSQIASRLDAILLSEKLKDAPVQATTITLKDTQDAFLVSERKLLAYLKP